MSDDNSKRRWFVLLTVLLGQFMLVLDATVVNVALPTIRADLDLAPATLTWITNAYLIAFGGLLLLFGRLGDLVGRRRVFLIGIALFTVASALCGLATTAPLLVAARFIQGIGAAAAASVVLAIIATEFPEPAERAKAMSGYMFVSVSGGSSGLLVGGALTQALDWHWIFLVNLPVGVAAIVLGRRVLREAGAPGLGDGVDYLGAVLATAAAMSGIYALVAIAHHGWGSPWVLVPALAALALLAMFFAVESTHASPLLPLRVLRIKSLMASSVVRGFMIMGMYSVFFFGVLELTQSLGFGPLRVGAAFLPMTGTVAILSLGNAAKLVRRFGPRTTALGGLTIIVLALAVFARIAPDAPYWPYRFGAYALLGLGSGCSFLPLLTIAMQDVPPRDAGLGSAIINLSLQLSSAVDLAVLVTVASVHAEHEVARGAQPAAAVLDGYRFGYTAAAIGVAIGWVLAFFLFRKSGAALPAGEPRRVDDHGRRFAE